MRNQILLDNRPPVKPPESLDGQLASVQAKRAEIVRQREERLSQDQNERQAIAATDAEIQRLQAQQARRDFDRGWSSALALLEPNCAAATALKAALDGFSWDTLQVIAQAAKEADDTFDAQMLVRKSTLALWSKAQRRKLIADDGDIAQEFELAQELDDTAQKMALAKTAYAIVCEYVFAAIDDPVRFQFRKGIHIALFGTVAVDPSHYEANMHDLFKQGAPLDILKRPPGNQVGPWPEQPDK